MNATLCENVCLHAMRTYIYSYNVMSCVCVCHSLYRSCCWSCFTELLLKMTTRMICPSDVSLSLCYVHHIQPINHVYILLPIYCYDVMYNMYVYSLLAISRSSIGEKSLLGSQQIYNYSIKNNDCMLFVLNLRFYWLAGWTLLGRYSIEENVCCVSAP